MKRDEIRQELDKLEEKELAYVVARSNTTKDAPAYDEAGYSRTRWYEIDKDHRDYLTDLAMKLKRQRTLKALMVLDENAEDAAKELVNLLDAESESVRLSAAKEVLDRTTGKPAQRVQQEVSGKDGGPIVWRVVYDDDVRSLDDDSADD